MFSKIRLGLLFLVLLLAASCQPCHDLEAKICADLGSDCAIWQKHQLFDSMVPDSHLEKMSLRNLIRKINNLFDGPKDKKMCRLYSDEHNYKTYTLPRAKHIVTVQKNPGRQFTSPSLIHPQMTQELFSENWLYFAVPGCILLIALYSALAFIRGRKQGSDSN